MSFALLLCGPRVRELEELAGPLVEELALRGLAARYLPAAGGDGAAEGSRRAPALPDRIAEATAAGEVALLLLEEPSRERREALLASAPEAVVVDWGLCAGTEFEPSDPPHLAVAADVNAREGLAQVLALLEGLGLLPRAEQTASPQPEQRELVEQLRELGYL
ncbi:MAG: hypothetical protein JXR83_07170 [Deltaproteobacteria bacterium]|nr:hypothetical protein [Deltaproteobacteria bacterium]